MNFAVQWAPSVNVWTPGWMAPEPAADAPAGANAMIASAQTPAITRRCDIPLPSVELVELSAAAPDGRRVLHYPITTQLSPGRFADALVRRLLSRQLPAK